MKKNFFYFVCLVLVCSLFLSGRPIEKPTMQNTIQSSVGRNIVVFPEHRTVEIGEQFMISYGASSSGSSSPVGKVGYTRNGCPTIINPGWCRIQTNSEWGTTTIYVTIPSVSYEHEGVYTIMFEKAGVNTSYKEYYLEVVQPSH